MSPFLIMLPVQYEVLSQATWTQFSLCVQENVLISKLWYFSCHVNDDLHN